METVKSKVIPQKTSIFSKIKVKIIGFRNDFVKSKNKFFLSEDYKIGKSWVLEILVLGVLANLTTHLFGLKLSVLNVLSLGAGIWLVKEKILPIVTELLGSFNLVKVYR